MSVPGNVLYFVAFDSGNEALQRVRSRHDLQIPLPWSAVVAGVVARTLTVVCMAPFEIVRTRLGTAQNKNVFDTACDVYKSGGLSSYWRGLRPTLLRDVPFSAVYWGCYDFCTRNWKKDFENAPWLFSFGAGFLSGAAASVISHPFDVLKTQRQVLEQVCGGGRGSSLPADHGASAEYCKKMKTDLFRLLAQGADFRKTKKVVNTSSGTDKERQHKQSGASASTNSLKKLDFFQSNKAAAAAVVEEDTAAAKSTTRAATSKKLKDLQQSKKAEQEDEADSEEERAASASDEEENSNSHEEMLDSKAASSSKQGQGSAQQAVAAALREQRKRHNKVRHVSSDCPKPWESFGAFEEEVPEWIMDNARNGLRFSEPTPIQTYCTPGILTRRDLLASAPTGSGKTMAFLLPLLALLERDLKEKGVREASAGVASVPVPMKKKRKTKVKSTATENAPLVDGAEGMCCPQLIIVDPTRELAQQTLREFSKLAEGRLLDFSPSLLDDGNTYGPETVVAISTPQKLEKMLSLEKKIDLSQCRYFVLDEVDKLLDLGFRDQIDAIMAELPKNANGAAGGEHEQSSSSSTSNSKSITKRPATLFFSATLPENVVNLAESVLLNPLTVHIGNAAAANSDVEQRLVFIGKEEAGKLFTLRTMLKTGELKLPCLIFLQSKDRARQLYQELRFDPAFGSEQRVDYMTAEREKADRDAAVRNFRTGKTWILICTDLMSRGVDLKHVEMVVNYDLPLKQSTYIHRIGRTGRAGKLGKSVSFFTEDDFGYLRPIVNVVRNSGSAVPEWMLQLKKRRKHRQEKGGQIEFRKHVQRKDIRTGGRKAGGGNKKRKGANVEAKKSDGKEGSLYTRGHLLPKDLNRGRRLLRKAAQCGEVDAWKQLALAVPEESAVWWEKAAKQGDAEALYVLAMRALNQYPDLSPALTSAQAIEQLKAAANKNWPEALHALGELYRGVAHPAHSYRLTERSVSELVRRDCVKSSRHLALACDALLSQRRELEKQNGAYEEKLLTVMVDFDAAISNQLLLSRVVHAWGAFVRRRKISLRKLVGKARQSFCRPTFGIWRQLVLRRFLDLRAAIEQPYDFGRLTGLCFAQWAFRVVVLPKRLGKIAATRARERSLRKVLQSWRIFSVRRRTAVFLLAETLRANLRRKELFPPAAVRRVYRGARLFTRLANRKLLTSGFAQLKLHGTKRGAEKRLVPEVERLTSENASLGEDLKIAFQRLADLEKANAHWQKRYDEEHSLNQRLLQSGLSGMPVAVAPENTTTFSTLLQQGTKSCDDEFMMRQGSPTLPVRAPRSAVGSKRSVVSLLSQTAEFVAGVAGESASKSSVVHQPFVFPSQLQTDQPQPQTTAELEDGAGGAADHEFAFRPRVRCSPPGAGDAADGGASSLDERIRELLGDDDPANIVAQHVEPSPTTTDGAQVFPDQQDEALRSNQMLFPSPARRLMQREVRSSRERLRGVLQQTRTSSDDEAALLASTSLEESDEFQDAESSASELVHLRDRWLRSTHALFARPHARCFTYIYQRFIFATRPVAEVPLRGFRRVVSTEQASGAILDQAKWAVECGDNGGPDFVGAPNDLVVDINR
eukprot:g2134.t1